jgi:hypothetical protein
LWEGLSHLALPSQGAWRTRLIRSRLGMALSAPGSLNRGEQREVHRTGGIAGVSST